MNVFTHIFQVLSFNSKFTVSVLLSTTPLRFISSINFAIIILKLKTEPDFPGATQLFLNAIFIPK